jgi:bacterioferritin-associated ferredoxin
MIVCSCNVLTDSDVRTVCHAAEGAPRSPTRVHGSAQCGRCLRTIKRIMDEALGACDVGCAICPHTGRKL